MDKKRARTDAAATLHTQVPDTSEGGANRDKDKKHWEEYFKRMLDKAEDFERAFEKRK